MSDAQAFLHTIIAQPDDDTPRLVFADWLDEHADPRGEFIRVQCELANLSEDDPRWPELEEREHALLKEHEAVWTKDVSKIVTDCRLRRGLVEAVGMGARKLLTHGEKLFRLAPVRDVELTRLGSSTVPIAELAACSLLARVRTLRLNGRLLPRDLRTLLASPHLAGLVSLVLPSPDAAHGLDESLGPLWDGAMPCLEELDLSYYFLGGDYELRTRQKLPFPLKKLNLSRGGCSVAALQWLGQRPWAVHLTHLSLRENELRVGGGQTLAEAKYLTGLTHLDLHGCLIGVTGTRALGTASHLASLTSLDVGANNIGASGVRAIVESPHLTRLAELNLDLNNGNPESMQTLARWPGLAQLTRLGLFNNQAIGDEGLQALLATPQAARLRHLDLGYTGLSAKGILALAQSPSLTHLRTLSVQGNYDIGDAGVKLLAQSANLAAVWDLNLARISLTDSGARALIESPHLTRLRCLRLNSNNLKAAGKKALQGRFGGGVCQFGQG